MGTRIALIAMLIFGIGFFSLTIPQTAFSASQTTIKLEQCHNGYPDLVDCDNPVGHKNNWGDGNANHQNSVIREGDSQNYRVVITDLPAGIYHLILEQDLTRGGAIAQDFWTGPGNILTENIPTLNNSGIHPCVDSKGIQNGYCDYTQEPYEVKIPNMSKIIPKASLAKLVNATQNAYNNPIPSNQLSSGMLMYGPITKASLFISKFSGTIENNSSIQGTLTFITNSTGNVVLIYGGHVSQTSSYPKIPTAIQIPGSSYHNRLISFDGLNGSPGSHDMQLMPSSEIVSFSVTKHVIGGSAKPDDFNLTINDIPVKSGETILYPKNSIILLGESSLPRYVFTSITGDTCPTHLGESFTLSEDSACTITNNYAASLTVIKEVIGGTAKPDDFALTVNGNQVLSGGTNFYASNIPLVLGETQQSNYNFTMISGVGCPDSIGEYFTLIQDTSCTITNQFTSPDLPTLTLIKEVDGGSATPNDFGISVNGTVVDSGDTKHYPADVPLAINEAGLDGYKFVSITGDAKCPANLGDTVTLADADEITCTITNTSVTAGKPGPDGPKWDTRPTFAMSHEERSTKLVENGFQFNDQFFDITDNWHYSMESQTLILNTVNTFGAKVYAPGVLHIQEFLFGVPEVGHGEWPEFVVDVEYTRGGEMDSITVTEYTPIPDHKEKDLSIIDLNSMNVSHEKVKCMKKDTDEKCDRTIFSAIFLENLQYNVIAIRAIDYNHRDQTTYFNEGITFSGKSFNPLPTKMIPSNLKNEGLIKVTQMEKYSAYWIADDGRIFEMNSFGSFNQVNQSFERFKDTGNPYNRLHSEFGKIILYEQKRATKLFDASNYTSSLPESFAYVYPEPHERIDEQMRQEMLDQENLAKDYLEKTYVQSRW